jgi:hypothetical protein
MYWGDQQQLAGGPVDQVVAAAPRRSVLRTWVRRWFPTRTDPPAIDEETRTWLITVVHLKVSWSDVLRLIVSRRAEVLVRNYTDVTVKDARPIACFQVLAPC